MIPPFVLATITERSTSPSGIGWVQLEAEHLARAVSPGQFAMVIRPQEPEDHLGRPYAYFRTHGAHGVRLLTRERQDQQTSLLRAPLGTQVALRGPLGRPFICPSGPVWCVAGGVGAAAFGTLCTQERLRAGLRLFVGLKGAHEAPIVHALEQALPSTSTSVDDGGHDAQVLAVSSDDGCMGQGGSVVQQVAHALQQQQDRKKPLPQALLACGPEGMLRAMAQVAAGWGVACQLSVNVALPCGIGQCGQCTHQDRMGRTRKACIDGPIYPAEQFYP